MKNVINNFGKQAILLMACPLLAIVSSAQDQQQENAATIKIAANTKYNEAGKFKRIMFGDHYRKEWATPANVEILDLTVFAGGLTPVKMGTEEYGCLTKTQINGIADMEAAYGFYHSMPWH